MSTVKFYLLFYNDVIMHTVRAELLRFPLLVHRNKISRCAAHCVTVGRIKLAQRQVHSTLKMLLHQITINCC